MRKFILAAALMLCAAFAFADTAADIKQTLNEKFPKLEITGVKESEIKGLYQVTAPGDIVYSDGNYILVGHIYDLKGHDLTQGHLDEALVSMAGTIDKSAALKIGNGKKEVIEFSDPECPFCLKAEEFFKNADVTRYIFFVPLNIHPNALRLSVDILCSDNPQAEYKKVHDAVAAGKADSYKAKSCEKGKEQLLKMVNIGEKFGVRGTPFFIIGDKAVSGADPVIMELLKQN